jgi:hypothetical protein
VEEDVDEDDDGLDLDLRLNRRSVPIGIVC